MSRALRARVHAGSTIAVASVLTLGSLVLLAGPAAAGPADPGQDPPGHNGDIKITAVDDESTPPENDPMQGCSLAVEWYGFDAGELLSQLTFEAIAPTADAVLEVEGLLEVPVGEDSAGGGTDLDAREIYTFTTVGEPGPQGFHVKLDVHTPGVTGPEKKSKVFWIGDCSTEEPTTEEPTTEEPTTGEPPTEEQPPVEPVLDPPAGSDVDQSADQPDSPVENADPVPAADDVPLSVTAGEQGSAVDSGPNAMAPGLLLAAGLLALCGYLLARSPRSSGARRR